jgi:hypothetical protein
MTFTLTITAGSAAELRQRLQEALGETTPAERPSARPTASTPPSEPALPHPAATSGNGQAIPLTQDPIAHAPPDAVAQAIAQMAETAAKPAKPTKIKLPKKLDKDAVRQVLEPYWQKHGEAATLALLRTHGDGVDKLSDVEPALYPALYAAAAKGLE